MCFRKCVYERNVKSEWKWASVIPAAVHVKAGECVYGGDGVALRRHWWLSTNTHIHTYKHRICFHKSPVILLLRAPEKVRQLPPISKRVKNVSVNEYVHVRVCAHGQLSGKTLHTCSLCGSSFPMSFSTWVILPNPSFTLPSKKGLVYLHMSMCIVSLSQTGTQHFDALQAAGVTCLDQRLYAQPIWIYCVSSECD